MKLIALAPSIFFLANTGHVMQYYRFVPVEYKPGQRYQGVENTPAPLPPGEPFAHKVRTTCRRGAIC